MVRDFAELGEPAADLLLLFVISVRYFDDNLSFFLNCKLHPQQSAAVKVIGFRAPENDNLLQIPKSCKVIYLYHVSFVRFNRAHRCRERYVYSWHLTNRRNKPIFTIYLTVKVLPKLQQSNFRLRVFVSHSSTDF